MVERQNKYLICLCCLIIVTFYLIDINISSSIYKNVTHRLQVSYSLSKNISSKEYNYSQIRISIVCHTNVLKHFNVVEILSSIIIYKNNWELRLRKTFRHCVNTIFNILSEFTWVNVIKFFECWRDIWIETSRKGNICLIYFPSLKNSYTVTRCIWQTC